MSGSRYAIYFAPEDGTALAAFGWPWLGRWPDKEGDAPFPSIAGATHAALVAEPRLYGLHATLKPPFHMAEGQTRAGLVEALHRFSAARMSVEAAPLALAEIDGFIAFRLRESDPAVDALAAACVKEFERFRAPPGAAETAKRTARGLTARQHELLALWGYPYVLEEFRFHVTLTGRLGGTDRARTLAELKPLVGGVGAEPLRIESLCLFEQASPGRRFVLTGRFPLAHGT